MLGLTPIQEQNYPTPSHWLEPQQNDYQIKYRNTLSPSRENFQRFFPKDASDSKKSEKQAQMNWAQAARIVKYEKTLERYREILEQSHNCIEQMERKLNHSLMANKILTECLRSKEEQLQKLHNKQGKNKKIIKLKEKYTSETFQTSEAFCVREQQSLHEEQHQISSRSDNRAGSHSLIHKIRQLEKERRFEEQRIQNATLSLQLDLKMKDKQIKRLKQQIQTYQNKFDEILKEESVTLQKDKTHQPCESLRSFDGQKFDKKSETQTQCQDEKSQKQNIKCGLKLKGQAATKRRHVRSGSSNLQEHPSRKRQIKVVLKMEPNMHRFS